MTFCMAGCADSSSSSDKSSSGSSSSSTESSSANSSDSSDNSVADSSGSSDSSVADSSGSSDSSAADSSGSGDSSSASDSSSAAKKNTNAIGYDVKTSDRLFDKLKQTSSSGYYLSMKSTADAGTETILNVKGNSVYCTNKSNSAHRSMLFTGGKSATILNRNTKTYSEMAVDDAGKFVAQNDFLFGITGDFVQAQIDEQSDLIGEYYKIKSDVTGQSGQICYCFSGNNGRLEQIFVTYDNTEMPVYFKIIDLKKCDESLFKLDLSEYKKAQ